jgi:hypothetical protein
MTVWEVSLNKPEAYIDNWVYDGDYLVGYISGHKHQEHFSPLTLQITSLVIHFDEPKRIAETQNTLYHLLNKNTQQHY